MSRRDNPLVNAGLRSGVSIKESGQCELRSTRKHVPVPNALEHHLRYILGT